MPKDKKPSSKTARVLGLLTGPAPEQAEPAPVPAPAPAIAEPPRPSDDASVEAEVRGALEQELEAVLEEAAPPAPKRTPAPQPRQEQIPQPQPAARPAPVPQPEHGPAPQPALEPQPQPVYEPASRPAAKPAPQPVYEPAPRLPDAEPNPGPKATVKAKPAQDSIPLPENPTPTLQPDICCFNITQALVEAKVDKYIKLFGLCDCPRCRIDVIALALTNLPPKYVVAREHEMVPLLSVYEGKYNAAIISQVMNACKLVMENPRHDRAE